MGTTTASALLGSPPGSGHALEVYVPPELLVDLHAPDLVITPGYIGPERRAWSRLAVGATSSHRSGKGGHRSLRLVEALVIVLASVALSVPVTLVVSHQLARAVPATPITPARPAGTARPAEAGAKLSLLRITNRPSAVRAKKVISTHIMELIIS